MNPSTISSFDPPMESYARVAALRSRLDRGGLRAAVVGAGKSGLAALDLLRARDCDVRILDDRADTLDEATRAAIGTTRLSRLDAASLAEVDLVVLSPGVPRSRPELEGVIERHRLVGEIELASWFVSAPKIGITGTNGKSTTTALTAHLLRTAGLSVFAGGNLGEPLSRLALSGEAVDVAVVELSSYQLESVVEASFAVACWLNLTPDHLDRYADVPTYAAAKRRLLERRAVNGVAVLNAKDPFCARAGIRLGGAVRWFAAEEHSDLAEPMGTRLRGEELVRVERGEEEVYRIGSPSLIGRHNVANAAAAVECARHFDVAPEAIDAGLASFVGLPHRLELVSSAAGVRWYNDSKATNVDSAVTALRALSAPTILIAGGKDKGAPWTDLVDAARPHVKAVLAIGAATPIVETSFAGVVSHVEACGTLERAVRRAATMAGRGDVVVLSPACASFDQFTNYEARGDAFRRWVKEVVGE